MVMIASKKTTRTTKDQFRREYALDVACSMKRLKMKQQRADIPAILVPELGKQPVLQETASRHRMTAVVGLKGA